MTLYIKLKSAEKLLINKGKIFIEGSQAGALTTEFSTKHPVWSNGFDVHCSKEDQLEFKVCGFGHTIKDQNIVGVAKFHSPSIVKSEANNLSLNFPFTYHIDARTIDGKQAGTFTLQLLYDKSQFYKGELNGIKIFDSESVKPVPLAVGKCKTRNLFSMLDGKANNQEDGIKFMESIYRDE